MLSLCDKANKILGDRPPVMDGYSAAVAFIAYACKVPLLLWSKIFWIYHCPLSLSLFGFKFCLVIAW